MNPIEPCPFCGGEAEVRYQSNLYGVRCKKCLATVAAFDTEAEAVKTWNRRTEPERKKGEWVRNFDGNEWHWYCSNCKEEWYEEDLWMGRNDFPNFCPNCGARMTRGE